MRSQPLARCYSQLARSASRFTLGAQELLIQGSQSICSRLAATRGGGFLSPSKRAKTSEREPITTEPPRVQGSFIAVRRKPLITCPSSHILGERQHEQPSKVVCDSVSCILFCRSSMLLSTIKTQSLIISYGNGIGCNTIAWLGSSDAALMTLV